MENKPVLPKNVSAEPPVSRVSRKTAISEIRKGLAVGVIASGSKNEVDHDLKVSDPLTPRIKLLENESTTR